MNIINLAAFTTDNGIIVAISLVTSRNHELNKRAKTVNAYLINICGGIGVK